ncbi:hypothetical protein MYCTH_2122615 [Thermothelomyces thermophilus ATCC 42464]|uniref:Uncharacterized protein n=1 Tax=Thermothelomyces thermophilus (strain ATCC 42464 / BCRC 31852 / DSM 1799) TaxID=573729 RepID=G2Q5B6_THET4|nr:uncharacterized protein MYCTH_2122615 [Thermothelomyces thermophilus ATCC 42464]AEO53747.1 hypothetical protein MYCTH_2122615 [Thermothelomyces thermophilus ATCC 42464]
MAQEAPEAQTEDKTDSHGVSHHHLGGLPSELFDKILFEINSIRDLAHFIATARFAYQRFRLQRRAVLFRVLQNELGPVLADARFLFVFPYSDPTDQVRYIEWLHLMADVYHGMLRGGNTEDGMPIQGDALPHLEELKALCRTLHQINFIADMYITARLASFDRGGGGGTPATAPLSPLERRRLVRSFYRRQILSNAWAATRRPKHWTHEDTAAISNSSTHQGEQLGLLGTLEPWEMQQIEHADVFITRLCLALVHHSPRTADGAPGIPPRQFDELFAHLHRLDQFLQTHRGVAKRAARDLAAAMELAHCSRLRDEYVNPYQMIPLRLAWQADRATSFPDPVRDKWDRDGLVVPYVGDGLDLAPYGWLDALGGRYVKWFGEGLYSIPRLPTRQSHSQSSDQSNALYLWRHAGFCLWDRKRVEALKGLSMFGGELYTGWVLNRSIERDD